MAAELSKLQSLLESSSDEETPHVVASAPGPAAAANAHAPPPSVANAGPPPAEAILAAEPPAEPVVEPPAEPMAEPAVEPAASLDDEEGVDEVDA